MTLFFEAKLAVAVDLTLLNKVVCSESNQENTNYNKIEIRLVEYRGALKILLRLSTVNNNFDWLCT